MSIRQLFTIILIVLAIVPLLVASIIGTLYYRDTLKQSIWSDELVQARAVANLTDIYTSSSLAILESTASRPTLINALSVRDLPFINTSLQFLQNKTPFSHLYVIDTPGNVITGYPAINGSTIETAGAYGLETLEPSVNYRRSTRTGDPTIYIIAPIKGSNGSQSGALIGEMDPNTFAGRILSFQSGVRQYMYIVNSTGSVVVHNNRTYMADMTDFSSLPAVRSVLNDSEGVLEQYNPVEGDIRLVAYAPVPTSDWGVVVAAPLSVAYAPVDRTTWFIAGALLAVALLSIICATIVGDYITRPILSIATATTKVTNGGGYRKYLPVGRKDEIGDLARKFDSMSVKMREDRERIADEKNRAELYLDIMGHDINNLNQSAMANLELLETEKGLTPEGKEMIADALTAVKGSAEVIDNVRMIQEINEGKLPLETVDINDLIELCIKEIPRPAGRKVTVDYQPRKGLQVKGSPVLKQVFCNITSNAVKHSTSDVTINIKVTELEKTGKKFYDVIIEDNGPGIADELKPRLFSRFQRGLTKAHGKGLGLYIARMLVERFGGTVAVEDRIPGDSTKGAKFVISLPSEAS